MNCRGGDIEGGLNFCLVGMRMRTRGVIYGHFFQLSLLFVSTVCNVPLVGLISMNFGLWTL